MTYVKVEQSRNYNPNSGLCDDVKYTPCPFGVRDLQHDECYSGNGTNRCKYFVCYDFEENYTRVKCACDLPRNDVQVDARGKKYVIDDDGNQQHEFDF